MQGTSQGQGYPNLVGRHGAHSPFLLFTKHHIMFNYNSIYQKSDHEYEIDRLQEKVEHLERQKEKEHERRLTEIKERADANQRNAHDWREALAKQAILCAREARLYPEINEDCYFSFTAEVCEKGIEIWCEVEAEKRSRLQELERQAQEIKDSIRIEVADRLDKFYEAHVDSRLVSDTTNVLRKGGNPSSFLNW